MGRAANNEFGEQDPWLSYLYTTLLVEERAGFFYSLIDEVLIGCGQPPIFRGILVEEERHLAEINEWLADVPQAMQHLNTLRKIEQIAFEHFMQAIAVELAQEETVGGVALMERSDIKATCFVE